MSLWELFWVFAKMGAITFGGGYAMLPIIEKELVEKRGLVTSEEILDFYAVGQCTPGVIFVNTATFVGHKLRGNIGGVVATLGSVFPSIVIITLIAAFLSNFAEIPAFQHAFAGIRVCVCVLILNAIIKLWKKAMISKATVAIFVIVFVCSLLFDISPIIYVLLCGAAGIVLCHPWRAEK